MFKELLSMQLFTGKPSSYLRDTLNLAAKLNIGDDNVRILVLKLFQFLLALL